MIDSTASATRVNNAIIALYCVEDIVTVGVPDIVTEAAPDPLIDRLVVPLAATIWLFCAPDVVAVVFALTADVVPSMLLLMLTSSIASL